MTGKERIRRAVLFQGPDRIPQSLPDPWGNDMIMPWPGEDPARKPCLPGEDEWGCVWEKDPEDKTIGQVKVHPLSDYSMLENFRFPDYSVKERYDKLTEQVESNEEEKFVLAGLPISFIHRLEYLRGHVEAWTDPYDHPRELGMLLDRLADTAIEAVKQSADRGADGIFSCDDWGLQDRPMLPPNIFREFFKPRYARVYGYARERGMQCFLHSCGHIVELLDDFIDAGLHVIQMDQQENMGVANLAGRFGGRLCFWCPVDIQQTMVNGTLDDIRAYARKLMDSFGSFNGGFIAAWYSDPEAIGHTQDRIDAMCEAFTGQGRHT